MEARRSAGEFNSGLLVATDAKRLIQQGGGHVRSFREDVRNLPGRWHVHTFLAIHPTFGSLHARAHFRRMSHNYEFRGVEVTVEGWIEQSGERLVLHVPGINGSDGKDRQIREWQLELAELKNKLQWNFGKQAARQPEPGERDAYRQLDQSRKQSDQRLMWLQVTGPLVVKDGSYLLEVREFFPLGAARDTPRYDGVSSDG